MNSQILEMLGVSSNSQRILTALGVATSFAGAALAAASAGKLRKQINEQCSKLTSGE